MLSIQWLAGLNSLADNRKMHDVIIGVEDSLKFRQLDHADFPCDDGCFRTSSNEVSPLHCGGPNFRFRGKHCSAVSKKACLGFVDTRDESDRSQNTA